MNILLIVVIAILLLCTIRGYRKGLFGIIFGIICWIFMAFMLIFGTPKMYTALYNNSSIYDGVYSRVEKLVSDKVDSVGRQVLDDSTESVMPEDEAYDGIDTSNLSDTTIPENKIEGYLSNLPPQIAEQIRSLTGSGNVNAENIINNANEKALEAENKAKVSVVSAIAVKITEYVIYGLAFLFTLILAWIIILIVSIFVKIIENSRGVKTVSHWSGLIFGLLEGFLIVFIILYIVSFVNLATGGAIVDKNITDNAFLEFLYTHNPIEKIFIKK